MIRRSINRSVSFTTRLQCRHPQGHYSYSRPRLALLISLMSLWAVLYALLGDQTLSKLQNGGPKEVVRMTDAAPAIASETTTNEQTRGTVHYVGCCGLGHRLCRTANAYHVARRWNYSLTVDWKNCDHLGVFPLLFGPEAVLEQQQEEALQSKDTTRSSSRGGDTASSTTITTFYNEVPGYKLIRRRPVNKNNATSACICHASKIQSDVDFYSILMNRYRWRRKLENFHQEHFTFNNNNTATIIMIGMHIRAGNGETGHFQERNRGISEDLHDFVENVAQRLKTLCWNNRHAWDGYIPKLFLATDTSLLVHLFRTALLGVMDVVDFPQERPKEGVLFGQDALQSGRECLSGWNAAWSDMMLLAMSDIVISVRKSSFVNSMPQSMVLGRPYEERKIKTPPFCEILEVSGELKCYQSYMEWCCDGGERDIVSQEVVHQLDPKENA